MKNKDFQNGEVIFGVKNKNVLIVYKMLMHGKTKRHGGKVGGRRHKTRRHKKTHGKKKGGKKGVKKSRKTRKSRRHRRGGNPIGA